ncbi:MAG: hypothetical protein L6W00_27015 [Lentisphaeria bacterium]|nr:MAG: hypothetical protein L6W00_27015 [Lentisphaeria bacterium]
MQPRKSIQLRFWQNKGQLSSIAAVADRWFDRITEYLSWLNSQIDAETAPLELLDLLAWQRDIDRLPGRMRNCIADASSTLWRMRRMPAAKPGSRGSGNGSASDRSSRPNGSTRRTGM